MPYCITLRSRTDARITGWYDGSDSRWSTDYKRQKLFDKKHDAGPVCDELRRRCPRNRPRRARDPTYATAPWPILSRRRGLISSESVSASRSNAADAARRDGPSCRLMGQVTENAIQNRGENIRCRQDDRNQKLPYYVR